LAKQSLAKNVVIYQDATGQEPFTEWLEGLRDAQTRRRILIRLRRVEQGNYGDYKALKEGVYELRLAFGPGYRIYFGEAGDTIVVLLLGGDKSSQRADIALAKIYWSEYQSHD
jgi:putative addiction module killer protein